MKKLLPLGLLVMAPVIIFSPYILSFMTNHYNAIVLRKDYYDYGDIRDVLTSGSASSMILSESTYTELLKKCPILIPGNLYENGTYRGNEEMLMRNKDGHKSLWVPSEENAEGICENDFGFIIRYQNNKYVSHSLIKG